MKIVRHGKSGLASVFCSVGLLIAVADKAVSPKIADDLFHFTPAEFRSARNYMQLQTTAAADIIAFYYLFLL